MNDQAPKAAQSSGLSNAPAKRRRKGRGGRRPGAGRPRKPRGPALATKCALAVDVGETVWFWIRPDDDQPTLVPRPGLVVARDDSAARPHAELTVRVFYQSGSDETLLARFSTSPAEGCWTLPPKQGGPPRVV